MVRPSGPADWYLLHGYRSVLQQGYGKVVKWCCELLFHSSG